MRIHSLAMAPSVQPWDGTPRAQSTAMTRQILSLLLAFALVSGTCFGQTKAPSPGSIEEQIRSIPPDSPVQIRLLDGSKLRGWISDVSDAGFVLTQEHKSRLEKSQIPFQQVQAVKRVKSVKPSHTTRNILIGVGIGIVVVAGVLAGLAASGPLIY